MIAPSTASRKLELVKRPALNLVSSVMSTDAQELQRSVNSFDNLSPAVCSARMFPEKGLPKIFLIR